MTGARPGHPRPSRRERAALRLFGLVNPLAQRMIPRGMPTGAPNILLIVRGRRSGIERTVPVTLLDLEGRWYVQATYGANGWARNLRAAGEATVVQPGGRRSPVRAVELPPEDAAAIFARVLESCRSSRLLRRLLGPDVRPPVALLRRYRVRVDDTPQAYVAEARRHPLFALQPA